MNDALLKKVKNLPKVPGVYKYFDASGKIIYIGKALNLHSRVGSYFSINLDPRSKTYALVNDIYKLDYIETQSEIEALILEAELIKKYQPFYNISLKDNKSFLYIVIRNEKIKTKNGLRTLPKVLVARKTDLLSTDEIFGPFPSSYTTRSVVKMIRKMFPYRDCSKNKFVRYEKTSTPCLYGQIGLCTSPCVNQDTENLKRYRAFIKKTRDFLKGKTSVVINSLEESMKKASTAQDYEIAGYYRDILQKFKYVRQTFHTPREYMENPYLVYDIADRSLKEIKKILPGLSDLPYRIECYDISTVSGTDSVGSMVVAIKGRIEKSEYKRFKVRTKNTPDDFAMMEEVLRRRLKRELSNSENISKWGMPDLIVLDGGRGQVSVVMKVLQELRSCIPVIGLAKKEETVIVPKVDAYEEIKLSRDNLGLQLLIQLRDESHRFAQKYHHLLRKKRISE